MLLAKANYVYHTVLMLQSKGFVGGGWYFNFTLIKKNPEDNQASIKITIQCK